MKYFTKALWAGFQKEATWKRAAEQWKQKYRAYCAQLEPLKTRLSRSARRFFSKPLLLHDGTLISCSVGDVKGQRLRAKRSLLYEANKLNVRLAVADEDDRKVHTLTYAGITKIKVDFPSDDPLFLRGEFFGDWGYDELTSAGRGHLRHEILFASGATILIEFRSLTHRAERIRKR